MKPFRFRDDVDGLAYFVLFHPPRRNKSLISLSYASIHAIDSVRFFVSTQERKDFPFDREDVWGGPFCDANFADSALLIEMPDLSREFKHIALKTLHVLKSLRRENVVDVRHEKIFTRRVCRANVAGFMLSPRASVVRIQELKWEF